MPPACVDGLAAEFLMILSPAKTLNMSSCNNRLCDAWTFPECDATRTCEIATEMKRQSPKELEAFLKISPNLAATAYENWSSFDLDPKTSSSQKPCILAFSGAAYQGLQAESCSDEALIYMQRNLRIIDAVYGVLRPLDVIQPYRLEMATKKVFKDAEKVKLSGYWQSPICNYLSRDLSQREHKVVLNLASDEYSVTVDVPSLPKGTRYIKIVFWENGRTIAVHAKRARGLMVRYLAVHSVNTMEGVQRFNTEGYTFIPSKSDEHMFVFDREKQLCNAENLVSKQSKNTELETMKRQRRR